MTWNKANRGEEGSISKDVWGTLDLWQSALREMPQAHVHVKYTAYSPKMQEHASARLWDHGWLLPPKTSSRLLP